MRRLGTRVTDPIGGVGVVECGGVETMAMPQRDDTIEATKRLDALLEYAVVHDDAEEAERIRAELHKLTESV